MKKRGAKFKRGTSCEGVARLVRQDGLEKSRKVDLLINPIVSLNELLTGDSPGQYHWDVVASSVNLAQLGESILPSGEGAAIERAMKYCEDCYYRGIETGKWRLNGVWLDDIKTALRVYDAQVESMTRNELQASLSKLMTQLDLHSAWKSNTDCALIYHNNYKNASVRYFDSFTSILSEFGIKFDGFGNNDKDEETASNLTKQLAEKSGRKVAPEIYILSKNQFNERHWYAHDNGLLRSFIKRGWIA